MSGSAGTPLRHDLAYLRRIVAEAVRLYPGRTAGDYEYVERRPITRTEKPYLYRRLIRVGGGEPR